MISKYVDFSIDEMMTTMQKMPDTKFRASALIKLFMALSLCYHKMIFDIIKSVFDITDFLI